ncbi:MAG: hypothetical protein RIT11_545 [Pseudomonadota bacterium]|jgi:nucleoside-diphosphate-sugar epimerase
MIISIIGTNGLLANEFGLYSNNHNHSIFSFGRKVPEFHKYDEFNILDLEKESIDINKISQSDVIIYTAGAGIQSNLMNSSESIYHLNVYVPIDICNKLNSVKYNGVFITFGSCFEIGKNSEDIQFSEIQVCNSILEVPNEYCVSKRLLSRFVNSYNPSFKHFHFILPTIYGQMEAKHRLIPYLINGIKNNEKMQFTSGKQIRQYLYSGDVPEIVFSLLPLIDNGIYNLSGVETFSVRQIIENVFMFYNLQINEELFGKAERVDSGMQNLQLDGSVVQQKLPNFRYTKFLESLKLYDKCL